MASVGVQVGRLVAVDPHRFELVTAAEALFEDRPCEHVPQLGLDDRARTGQLDVLDGHDREQLAVHLEHRPVPKVVGRDHSAVRYSIASSYPLKPRPVITPRAARAVTLFERNSSREWMFEMWTSTAGTASACRQS